MYKPLLLSIAVFFSLNNVSQAFPLSERLSAAKECIQGAREDLAPDLKKVNDAWLAIFNEPSTYKSSGSPAAGKITAEKFGEKYGKICEVRSLVSGADGNLQEALKNISEIEAGTYHENDDIRLLIGVFIEQATSDYRSMKENVLFKEFGLDIPAMRVCHFDPT